MRYLWLSLGILSLIIGFIGIVLPLLPTVPLMILAAFFFARSSPKLHQWLVEHKVFGEHIQNWNQTGAIARKAKYLATATIIGAFAFSVFLGLAPWLLILQASILSGTLLFIWTRPDG